MNPYMIAAILLRTGHLDDYEHAERFANKLGPQTLPWSAAMASRQIEDTINDTRITGETP